MLHDLTFAELRETSLARCNRWHPTGIGEWSLSDWFTATMGELGEAANVGKKLNRIRDGIVGNTCSDSEGALRSQLADELADVAIYLDILAASEGIDLALAIARKFNRTSEKVGFPERLRELPSAVHERNEAGAAARQTREVQQEHRAVLDAAGIPDDTRGGGQEHSEIMRAIGH